MIGFLRALLITFWTHLDLIAILLLSVATIHLSFESKRQGSMIHYLKEEVEKLKY